MRTKRAFVVVTAVALMLAVISIGAQQAPPPSTAQGQLMRVEATGKVITIQTSSGSPMVFRYTDETKITGALGGVAGLATMAGTQVTIQYIQQDKDNVATQIEVQAKP